MNELVLQVHIYFRSPLEVQLLSAFIISMALFLEKYVLLVYKIQDVYMSTASNVSLKYT